MEILKNGNLEKLKFGKMEIWKNGNFENGNLDKWKFGKRKFGKTEI